MRILLDHCLPRRLRNAFASDQVSTAADQGWQALRNGELLATAASQFDVILTNDGKLKYEQNLATLPIAVIVLIAKSNRLADLLPLVPIIEEKLQTLPPRSLIEVSS